MRLLLDTHALLWSLTDSGRLGELSRAIIVDRDNSVAFSMVSLWEIAIKARVGKLDFDQRTIAEAAVQAGFALLDLDRRHLDALDAVPMRHRDPFDHLLMAQAMAEDLRLMTSDRSMRGYPVDLLWCG